MLGKPWKTPGISHFIRFILDLPCWSCPSCQTWWALEAPYSDTSSLVAAEESQSQFEAEGSVPTRPKREKKAVGIHFDRSKQEEMACFGGRCMVLEVP